jgi:hypothetical protein
VEADEALDPFDVGVFGTYRIVLGTKQVAHLVEGLLGGWWEVIGWTGRTPCLGAGTAYTGKEDPKGAVRKCVGGSRIGTGKNSR